MTGWFFTDWARRSASQSLKSWGPTLSVWPTVVSRCFLSSGKRSCRACLSAANSWTVPKAEWAAKNLCLWLGCLGFDSLRCPTGSIHGAVLDRFGHCYRLLSERFVCLAEWHLWCQAGIVCTHHIERLCVPVRNQLDVGCPVRIDVHRSRVEPARHFGDGSQKGRGDAVASPGLVEACRKLIRLNGPGTSSANAATRPSTRRGVSIPVPPPPLAATSTSCTSCGRLLIGTGLMGAAPAVCFQDSFRVSGSASGGFARLASGNVAAFFDWHIPLSL